MVVLEGEVVSYEQGTPVLRDGGSAFVKASTTLKGLLVSAAEDQSVKCDPPPPQCRGAALIRNTHPPRITIGPQEQGYCRVLRGRCLL